ncbi:MAG TPA: hypothetical protein VGO93_03600 [Candidatus Xenobia bacterium]
MKRPGGFTLAEIIVATTLLCLVVVMMFNLYPTSLITIRHAEHRLTASARAQHVLEYERALPFHALASVAAVSPTQLDMTPTPTDPPADDGVTYKSDVTVAATGIPTPNICGATGYSHLYLITVTEWWNCRSDCPNPARYHTWHSMTSQLSVGSIHQ